MQGKIGTEIQAVATKAQMQAEGLRYGLDATTSQFEPTSGRHRRVVEGLRVG